MSRPELDRQEAILDLLGDLRGPQPLKQLFWTELNYERVNQPLSRRGWPKGANEALAEDPILFAEHAGFSIIYGRLASERLLLTRERPVVTRLLRDHPYALFVFSNTGQDRWHFVNVKLIADSGDRTRRRLFRRITIGPEERLRTASERIAMLDLATISEDLFGLSPLLIQERHDEAFDVEAVTDEFYRGYEGVFKALWDDLARQTTDRHWAHDYALQFLNRVMFLYFVQRKRWLGDNTEFLEELWKEYRSSQQSKDSFVSKWLNVLFFEAFNNRYQNRHRHFSKWVNEALSLAPSPHGGLFRENDDLDRQRHDVTMADNRFEQVFKFLQRYNFTIAESTPLDQEVAVDPEMIGKVYEGLVNVAEEIDQRGEAGIFYTPRTEIDLMCRLALVDNLANHLGAEHKGLLYEAVFAYEPEEKDQADEHLAKAGLWPDLAERLRDIAVVDPACGSGSFLVGMLQILDDLQERANRQLQREETVYERRKRIIGSSLYGVDVMEWACRVAELRLWLALIIDALFTREELAIRQEPLLPDFSFNIRPGDSLVQEVAGINLRHRRGREDIPKQVKRRLRALQNAKSAFYNNEPDPKFKTGKAIRNEEVSIFRDLLAAKVKDLDDEAKGLMRLNAQETARQMTLDAKVQGPTPQLKLAREKREHDIEQLMTEKDGVEAIRGQLRRPEDVPFVWDIAFAEIMESDRRGFDIAIGNPPYVRQESIYDPSEPREGVTRASKRDYKAKLARAVYQAYPRFFAYTFRADTAGHKLDARSDLYIYFYFLALSLLNKSGSFCFITSNSWLDVGYGRDLQEFLLKHCHVKMVLDNQAKRSFARADINTVIVLFSAPDDSRQWGLDETARFVMFRVPFEHVLSPVIFQEIEEAGERTSTQEFRVLPIGQKESLADGCAMPGDADAGAKARSKATPGPLIKTDRYVGNKWGGKYLRAPGIYWRVLEKARGKLVRLGEVAKVRFGIKTGANEFFYLNEEEVRQWRIEDRFLRPVIKTPRDCPSIHICAHDLKLLVFMCSEAKSRLKGTRALEYIEWAEGEGLDERPSLAGRELWYALPELRAEVLWWKSVGERYCCFWNPESFFADQRNYPIQCRPELTMPLLVTLNSTFDRLFLEVSAREMTGAYTVIELSVEAVRQKETIDPRWLMSVRGWPGALTSFKELMGRPILNLNVELLKDDRRALDVFIARALGLSERDVDDLYETVQGLVYGRLEKSRFAL